MLYSSNKLLHAAILPRHRRGYFLRRVERRSPLAAARGFLAGGGEGPDAGGDHATARAINALTAAGA